MGRSAHSPHIDEDDRLAEDSSGPAGALKPTGPLNQVGGVPEATCRPRASRLSQRPSACRFDRGEALAGEQLVQLDEVLAEERVELLQERVQVG